MLTRLTFMRSLVECNNQPTWHRMQQPRQIRVKKKLSLILINEIHVSLA
jgi:hypothetical protein